MRAASAFSTREAELAVQRFQRMTGLNVARVAKLVALLGFFLPWVLVSCSGEPIAHLTGIDLATGGLLNQGSGSAALQGNHPNLWVLLSLAAVVGGIVLSFVMAGRGAIGAMLALAIIALVASAIGVSSVTSTGPTEPRGTSSAPLVPSDLQYGYVITVAGLLAAIGACGMALSRRRSDPASG